MNGSGAMHRISGHIILTSGWRRRLYAFAAGALATLALAPLHFAPAMFMAMPVLVWLADSAATEPVRNPAGRFMRGFSVGWFAGFGYFLAGLWWIGSALLVEAEQFAWALPLAVIALPGGLAVFWGAGMGLALLVWREGAPRIFLFAAFLALGEYARGELFTGFPWNAPGLAAMPVPLLMQSVAVAGVAGMTLLALIVFAAAAAFPAKGAGAKFFLVFAVSLVAGHAGFGAWRLGRSPQADNTAARLRLVQPAIAQQRKWTPAFSDEVLGALLYHSSGRKELAEISGVDLLVWPESAFPFVLTERPDALAAIGALLPQGAELVTGALRVERPAAGDTSSRAFNSVYLIDANGAIRAATDKNHLVPFGEYLPFQAAAERAGLAQLAHWQGGFVAGNARAPMATARAGRMLALVCYEAIFPGEARGALRPEFIVNVTNDAWFGNTPGPYQHWHHARVAAVALGLPLVRAANSGVSAVTDAHGRIVAAIAPGVAGHVDAALPQPAAPTIYWRFGDTAFAALAMLALAAGLLPARR